MHKKRGGFIIEKKKNEEAKVDDEGRGRGGRRGGESYLRPHGPPPKASAHDPSGTLPCRDLALLLLLLLLWQQCKDKPTRLQKQRVTKTKV
jgi:hypothetical protein